MTDGVEGKPATAARIYDYHLGGTHNFPADRAAGQAVAERNPLVPAMARTNRAFLRRAVTYLAEAGIRQFLDVGSGIPTEGNVHEIAQNLAPDARVVYVDIDPVAVMESLEILDGNDRATAIRADLRDPETILNHPNVRGLLDFERPVALLLGAVLHFVPDDTEAIAAVAQLRKPLQVGSYLVISHAASLDTIEQQTAADEEVKVVQGVYEQRTASPFRLRSRDELATFFTGLEMVEPGLVWLPQWRPAPDDPQDFIDDPSRSFGLGGVGRS
jgi:SAM-dependent methyltransferase